MDTQNIELQKDMQHNYLTGTLTYSIQLSGKNLFKACSVCDSAFPRMPYEIVDNNREPLCYDCARKVAADLVHIIDLYMKETQILKGMLDTKNDKCKYEFCAGFSQSFKEEDKIERLLKEISVTMYKFGVFCAYYTNIFNYNHNIFLSVKKNAVSDHRAHQAIRELFIENEKVGMALKYVFIHAKIIKESD